MRDRYYRCSLCDQEFNQNDSLFEARKAVHERWHKNCNIEKRNTTQDEVKWI